MSNNTFQTRILPTFALSVLLAATGCSIGAEQGDLDSANADVLNDSAELDQEPEFNMDAPSEHDEASDSKIEVAGSSDKKLVPGLSVPEQEEEPEAPSALPLSGSYLDMIVRRIRYVTPSEMTEVVKDDFLTFDFAGALNLSPAPFNPAIVTGHRYDEQARVLEISFTAADNTNHGSMDCAVSETQSAASHERRFECNFSLDNGESEFAGQVNLSHELYSDSLRSMVSSKDYRSVGVTHLNGWVYIQQVSSSCYTVQSNHRISTPNGVVYAASMADAVQCENRCQPESGRIEMSVAAGADAEGFTLTAVTGDPWSMKDVAGTTYAVNACH